MTPWIRGIMYSLFTNQYSGHTSVVKPPGFDLIKRTYQREIDKIIDYFNNRVFAVKGDHLLCRLLMIASVPVQYDIDQFMEIVYARSPFIAKHFRLTTDRECGLFHDGIFYGPGNQELIFSNEDYFNPYDAIANWKNLRPIKVLSHQISDLALMLPNGYANSTGQGFCSISINLPMLICMYRGFLMEQTAKITGDGESTSLLGVTHFVHMYVLPGMLESHIDIVLLNRLNNLFKNQEMSLPLRKHVFNVIDYGVRIDEILKDVIGRLTDKRATYFSYLQNIPSIYHESMLESLVMPDFPHTRQVWWALNLSRFEVMNFLINIGGEAGVHGNGTLINEMKKTCRYLARENMLKSLLPPQLYFDISVLIQDVIAL